ncbi:uncharacterized protein LOC121781281 [Salvia splendens]|uniref:uncharacterized protein LOC121781281 n=1 Tax=Salvia splendens TaxID=180675 RepID=UPI001C26CEF3|nr:uncharacterized protein LOC121781281 [Salvia splendens]
MDNILHSTSTQPGSLQTATSTTGNRSDGDSMYEAVLEGDWEAIEKLLERAPSLAFVEINERGDRALHLAAAMGNEEIVRELVERISSCDDLALLDGRGCTACCYAAISGDVEVADIMLRKNPCLVTARDKNNATPLHKAAFCGNKEMVSYFLKSTKVEDFSNQEWFDILLLLVRTRMYDVGLELLEKNVSLATMRNEEGTVLHALARQDISHFRANRRILDSRHVKKATMKGVPRRQIEGVMQPDLQLLAEKVWTEVQRLDRARVRDLMKNPLILHDAARFGNVELITMLTRDYPNLIWETDSDGYTIFHVAVMYRRENVFRLIYSFGAFKHLLATSQDQNGDHILHLAAK